MSDVNVEVTEPDTPALATTPDVVVVNAGTPSDSGTSDAVMGELLAQNTRLAELEAENERMRRELYEAQAQASAASATAEAVAEVIEEAAAEVEVESEPEVRPEDDEKPRHEHPWFAPIGNRD